MSACEKCWTDSSISGKEYQVLLKEREAHGETCSPEEQAGLNARYCQKCKRRTKHQHTNDCMNPECSGGTNNARENQSDPDR
jgi:hypothetical protein